MEKTTTAVRVTKVQRYADIKALLLGDDVSFGTDIDTALEFLDKEIELIGNKNASKNKKQTAVAEQNTQFRGFISSFLAIQDTPVTCSEIKKGIPELSDFENQKIAALLRPMVYDEVKNPDGTVKREISKGKSVFSLL